MRTAWSVDTLRVHYILFCSLSDDIEFRQLRLEGKFKAGSTFYLCTYASAVALQLHLSS